jgi:hypothetical protein
MGGRSSGVYSRREDHLSYPSYRDILITNLYYQRSEPYLNQSAISEKGRYEKGKVKMELRAEGRQPLGDSVECPNGETPIRMREQRHDTSF